MTVEVNFRYYKSQDREDCLKIFDANCPKFFASNERSDYAAFLDASPTAYEVCILNGDIVGAFGLLGDEPLYQSINWIMISPSAQGYGIGSIFMDRAISVAKRNKLEHIKIAASHLSAPFFSKYGAVSVSELENGWGLGMHRVDMELYI